MIRREMKELKAKINTYLIGIMCGVTLAATFTYVFTIPANNYYWQSEIWNRGGAAWTVDKYGKTGCKWIVEPKADTRLQKSTTVPLSEVNVRNEKL